MCDLVNERVRFQFGDRDLVGRVVDAELVATVGAQDYRLTVDVDGLEYPVLAGDTEAPRST